MQWDIPDGNFFVSSSLVDVCRMIAENVASFANFKFKAFNSSKVGEIACAVLEQYSTLLQTSSCEYMQRLNTIKGTATDSMSWLTEEVKPLTLFPHHLSPLSA